MERFEIVMDSEADTRAFATRLAEKLEAGDIVTLSGDLGTGKTTFTKGIAAGLGVKRAVTSPTFTIMKEYQGRLPLYHIDAYRLEHSEEDIGLDDYIYGNGVTVIEWAVFIEDFLPEERLEVAILYMDETRRKLTVTGGSPHFRAIIEELRQG